MQVEQYAGNFLFCWSNGLLLRNPDGWTGVPGHWFIEYNRCGFWKPRSLVTTQWWHMVPSLGINSNCFLLTPSKVKRNPSKMWKGFLATWYHLFGHFWLGPVVASRAFQAKSLYLAWEMQLCNVLIWVLGATCTLRSKGNHDHRAGLGVFRFTSCQV